MERKGLMIAISGKGGVGKTTLSSLFCHILANRGCRVLAVDADPDANLGMALGFDLDPVDKVTTIAHDRQQYEAKPEHGHQHWHEASITVEEIPQKYTVMQNGITLLQMGAVAHGGDGCACTENTFLRTLLSNLVISENDAVIVDMEAGLEHLGRGTGKAVDAFITVVEPGQRSFSTAKAVARLAGDLGVSRIYAVVSKLRGTTVEAVQSQLKDIPVIGAVPYFPQAVQADLQGKPIFECCPEMVEIAEHILNYCQEQLNEAV